jgi:hypothetical protein
MLSEDQKKYIIRNIPEDFMAEGIPFHVQKIYANQYECEKFPAVVLQYMSQDIIDNKVLQDIIKSTKQNVDVIRYHLPGNLSTEDIKITKFPVINGPPGLKKGGYYGNSTHSNYMTSWNEIGCSCGGIGNSTCGGSSFRVGQAPWGDFGGEPWYIRRAWLYFNLASLLGKHIKSMMFKFWPTAKEQGRDMFMTPYPWQDFDIDVQYGSEERPSLEMPNCFDFYQGYYSGSLSEKINTGVIILNQYNALVMNSNGIAKMTEDMMAGRAYRITLRSMNDINATLSIDGWLKCEAETVGREPYLEFTLYDETEYPFSYGNVFSIDEVKGTVDGSPYTFEESEYELVNDGIKFLGPNFPDDNTNVEVTYSAAYVFKVVGAKKHDNLMVQIYADDVFEGKRKLNGIILVEVIATSVRQWFEYTMQRDDMVVLTITPTTNTDFEVDGKVTRRRTFTVSISYWEAIDKQPVESIEEVEKVPVTPSWEE